jgi:type 1 fimbriae regulatory protein FimB
MFRHGLRVSEACGLVLSQVDTESRVLHVARLKKGLSTTPPLRADELRAIKAWLTDRAKMKPDTDAFFVSERRGPLSRRQHGLRSATMARWPASPCPRIRTCSATLAASPWPTRRGHASYSRLPWAQEHSAHREVHGGNPARFEKLLRQ